MAVGLSDTESPSPPLLQVPPVKLAALAAPATVAPAALESTTADKPAPRYAALMQDTPTAIDVPAVKPEGGRAPAFCAPRLSLLPAPAQSVTAILRAPCHAGRPVTFDHAGIRFTLRLDAGGRLQIRIPALESPARVTARLEDGLTASAQRNVAGLGRVARVALSWPGGVELNLRAREAILRRVAQSDVWQGAPRSPAEALREGGGYLIALGEPAAEGHLAEIYSWPLRRQDRRRIVPLVLELVTGPGNCRRPVRVTAVYADRPRRPERRVVVIANRRCAPGGIVLRNDGLRDLRLAGN
ncbi:MAG: hypothetical protein D6754_15185 [Alphaproteobacteria bacterium]|nr:MAG: hypothetical protein D6754_15185 [Alphaproteobacteria bacterium]